MTLTDPLIAVPLLAGAWYLIVHIALIAGLKRVSRAGTVDAHPSVSVVVAARNEEQTIGALLATLRRQTYSSFECVIVDDRSDDRTATVVEEAARIDPRIRLIRIDRRSDDMPAKKNALRTGIAASTGTILCFTDADCLPPPQWLERLVGLFDDETGLVAGYSPYRIRRADGSVAATGTVGSLFHRFIAYEELRGALWAAGSIGVGCGWLCTGRNLAYRRAVYDEVGGFDRIKMSISGDDDLFLQVVRRTTRWKIRYCVAPDNQVPTFPPETFGAFVRQRTRHFSAGKFFSVPQQLFFLSYHGANLLAYLAVIAVAAGGPVTALSGFLLKIVADAILIGRGATVFRERGFRPAVLQMEVLYALYNTLIGPLGFIGKVRWKTA